MKYFFLINLLILGAGLNASALTYDCGVNMGLRQSLVISAQNNPENPFKATLKIAVSQPRAMAFLRTYDFEGITDIATDDNGKETPVYSLTQVGNPTLVLFVAKGSRVGASYKASLNSLANGRSAELVCKLTKK